MQLECSKTVLFWECLARKKHARAIFTVGVACDYLEHSVALVLWLSGASGRVFGGRRGGSSGVGEGDGYGRLESSLGQQTLLQSKQELH